MEPDRRAARLIAAQDGAISRSQASELGFSDAQIAQRLAVGRWVRLCRGVYAPATSESSWHQRLRAAILSNPEALVAGRSAAVLLDFPGFPRTRPEILMPFDGDSRSDIARVIRSRHFDSISRTKVNRFKTTTPAETVLTLSLRETAATIERLVDDLLARRKLRMVDFDPILDRLAKARQRGLPPLKRIIAARSSDAYRPPTSELERMLYRLLDQPGVPPYSRQLPIEYPTVRATVDAFIEKWRLIVESDGRAWHTRSADFDRDRKRDNAAAAEGFQVVRFTYSMLDNEWDECLRTLLDAGSHRERVQ